MHRRFVAFIAFTFTLFLAGCHTSSGRTDRKTSSVHDVPVGSAAQSLTTHVLYSRAADGAALDETANTGSLWTPPSGTTALVDVLFENDGSAAIDGNDPTGWAQPTVYWGQGDFNAEWLPTFQADECGTGPIQANTVFSLASLDPGCTGLGLDDGHGGVTYPSIASGDYFTFDATKWGAGIKLPATKYTVVVTP